MKQESSNSFNKKKGEIKNEFARNVISVECSKCGKVNEFPNNKGPLCNFKCPKCGHKEDCDG